MAEATTFKAMDMLQAAPGGSLNEEEVRHLQRNLGTGCGALRLPANPFIRPIRGGAVLPVAYFCDHRITPKLSSIISMRYRSII
jgi:hypothetical protein